MQISRLLPLAEYAEGEHEFGPWQFEAGLNNFSIRLGRCTSANPTIWPSDSVVIAVDVQFSRDGGITYTPRGQYTFSNVGGVQSGRSGEKPESLFGFRFPDDPLQPTHAKATMMVAGGSANTYLDVVTG